MNTYNLCPIELFERNWKAKTHGKQDAVCLSPTHSFTFVFLEINNSMFLSS